MPGPRAQHRVSLTMCHGPKPQLPGQGVPCGGITHRWRAPAHGVTPGPRVERTSGNLQCEASREVPGQRQALQGSLGTMGAQYLPLLPCTMTRVDTKGSVPLSACRLCSEFKHNFKRFLKEKCVILPSTLTWLKQTTSLNTHFLTCENVGVMVVPSSQPLRKHRWCPLPGAWPGP